MPPMMTTAVMMPKIMPTAMRGNANGRLFSMTSAMALICVPQPMPNDASIANSANTTAITLPNVFHGRPRSSAYIAPPIMRPSAVFTRYLTAIRLSAYLVAMPNTPVSQHHSTAPGPPMNTAVPTPTMLPVPMVDASAVVRA